MGDVSRPNGANGETPGTAWKRQRAPDGAAEGWDGDWLTRRRGGGRFPAEAQRRWEDGTWFPSLPLL